VGSVIGNVLSMVLSHSCLCQSRELQDVVLLHVLAVGLVFNEQSPFRMKQHLLDRCRAPAIHDEKLHTSYISDKPLTYVGKESFFSE